MTPHLTSWWRKPSALKIAVEALEDTQREALAAASHAEYYAGLVEILKKRQARLQSTIAALGAEAKENQDGTKS